MCINSPARLGRYGRDVKRRWLVVVGMSAVGGTALVLNSLQASRAKREFEQSVARLCLRAEVEAPAPMQSADAAEWLDELLDLDQQIEERVPSDSALAAAWMWSDAHRSALAGIVDAVRLEIERVRILAARAPLLPPLMNFGQCSPHLHSMRHRTNLLCASALVDADPTRLCDALDILRACDDGSLISGALRHANAMIVLTAVRALVLDPRVDTEQLWCEIDSRLDELDDLRSIVRRVALEASWAVGRGIAHACSATTLDAGRRIIDAHVPWLEGCAGSVEVDPRAAGAFAGFAAASQGGLHCARLIALARAALATSAACARSDEPPESAARVEALIGRAMPCDPRRESPSICRSRRKRSRSRSMGRSPTSSRAGPCGCEPSAADLDSATGSRCPARRRERTQPRSGCRNSRANA